jgi:hypothetical protein
VSSGGPPARGPIRSGTIRPRRLPGGADLRRFVAGLRHPGRLSTIRAVGDGAYVAWTLKRRGIRPLMKRKVATTVGDSDRTIRIAAAVDAGLGIIPAAPTCLRRSVTLMRELDRLGLASTLHIGVRSVDGGTIAAHAWVQVDDVVVNDDPGFTGTYTELAVGELDRLLPLLK